MEYSVEYSVNEGSGFQTSFEYILPLEASGFGILELQDSEYSVEYSIRIFEGPILQLGKS